MAHADLKTKENDANVEDFLASIPNDQQREDSMTVCKMMQDISGESPKMWGASIIGFGNQHLKYPTGRELDWMIIGFSPRKANLTLYVLGYEPDELEKELLQKLGPHSIGKSCLYIKKLADVDTSVLKELVTNSFVSAKTYGS